MRIGNLCSYYAYKMFLIVLLWFCIESPFVKIPQEPKIIGLLDSDDEE